MSELVDQISKLEAKAHALKESVNKRIFYINNINAHLTNKYKVRKEYLGHFVSILIAI